ncbi:MAG: hypothetical protein RDV41_06525 [Planctomycetota bacterium]|nr:hypothetical protein [Planctomycetota bacterium]
MNWRVLFAALIGTMTVLFAQPAAFCQDTAPELEPVTGRMFVTPDEYADLIPFAYADTTVLLMEDKKESKAPKVFLWTTPDLRVIAALEVYVSEGEPSGGNQSRFVSAVGEKHVSQGILYLKDTLPEGLVGEGGSVQVKFFGKAGDNVAVPFRPLLKGASVVGRVSAGSVPLDLTKLDLSRVGVIGRDASGQRVFEKTVPLTRPVFGEGETVVTKTDVYLPFRVHYTGDVLVSARFDPPLEFKEGDVYYSTILEGGAKYVEGVGRGAGTLNVGSVSSAESGQYPIGLRVQELVSDPCAGADVARVGAWASGPVVAGDGEQSIEGIASRETLEKGMSLDGLPVIPGGRGGEGNNPMLWAVPLGLTAGELAIQKLGIGEKETYVTAVPRKLDKTTLNPLTPGRNANLVVATPRKLELLPVCIVPSPSGDGHQAPRSIKIPGLPVCKYNLEKKPGEAEQFYREIWACPDDGETKLVEQGEWKKTKKVLDCCLFEEDKRKWRRAGNIFVYKAIDGEILINAKIDGNYRTPDCRPDLVKHHPGGELVKFTSGIDGKDWGRFNRREKKIIHTGSLCTSGHAPSCTAQIDADVAISGTISMKDGWGGSSGNVQCSVQGELWTVGLAEDKAERKKIDITQKEGESPQYKLVFQIGTSQKEGPYAKLGPEVTWSPISTTPLDTANESVSMRRGATCGVEGTLYYKGIIVLNLSIDDVAVEIHLKVSPTEFGLRIVKECAHP